MAPVPVTPVVPTAIQEAALIPCHDKRRPAGRRRRGHVHAVRLLLGVILCGPPGCAAAGPPGVLPPGFELHAGNLDTHLDSRLGDERLGDMLPAYLREQIERYGLRLWLQPPEAHPLDPAFVEWTARNRAAVRFAPGGGVRGWQAGVPFPDVSEDDPRCGEKVIWNLHLGAPVGTDTWQPRIFHLAAGAEAGLTGIEEWALFRYYHQGRWGTDEIQAGDPAILHRTLLYAREPFQLKGMGTYTVKYMSGRSEDNWAWVRSFRRARRLSSQAWMDPIGRSAALMDDLDGFNADPGRYRGFRCLGQRTILATINARRHRHDPDGATPAARFPTVDLDRWPHFQPINDWQPVQVMVVEATPPERHPYGRKLLYVAMDFPRVLHVEAWDRQGRYRMFMNFMVGALPSGTMSDSWAGFRTNDGKWSTMTFQAHFIDVQRLQGSVFVTGPSGMNRVGMEPDEISLHQLERTATR